MFASYAMLTTWYIGSDYCLLSVVELWRLAALLCVTVHPIVLLSALMNLMALSSIKNARALIWETKLIAKCSDAVTAIFFTSRLVQHHSILPAWRDILWWWNNWLQQMQTSIIRRKLVIVHHWWENIDMAIKNMLQHELVRWNFDSVLKCEHQSLAKLNKDALLLDKKLLKA